MHIIKLERSLCLDSIWGKSGGIGWVGCVRRAAAGHSSHSFSMISVSFGSGDRQTVFLFLNFITRCYGAGPILVYLAPPVTKMLGLL